MNRIDLFEDGCLISDARMYLKLFEAYPIDTASREQAMLVAAHEKQRWLDAEPGKYVTSSLVHSLIQAISKADGQRGACGLVGLAMFALRYLDIEPSLKRASALVSDFVEDNRRIELVQWFHNDMREVSRPIPKDIPTIQTCFRSHRSVAHIIAAEMSCSFEHKPKLLFGWSVQETEEFVATAYYFQEVFRSVHNFEEWGLWEIASPPEGVKFQCEPILPTTEAFLNFVGVWISRQGLFSDEG